ncbi:hypothetical protein GYMLUDRAFT_42065 [Collybiopsis luxurians FD-317 M1]|uniref:VHS domain-containing protein n=1 Tax=Collybiopsis luxurians FD-317 M1 TaxID=944289 RepID=A0A0D0CT87_9AGAR|nr:hypothetical protein GYMLUDRAFT_42065 [Collybiopsis luxurians FD-317 M1]
MMLQSPTGSGSSSSWSSSFASSSMNPLSRVSPLEVLITRACDPSLPEPNYAAQLEVAEYLNTKKANTPREAALLLARLANNRNPHISMLALSLLSILVQSCGYPFHLQIATKEFLNELVRRFPERPPPYPNAVMSRILELINEWKEGICVDSRWKEDLGNIRDMWRLLTFKGYRFRDFPRRTESAGANVAANLKSATELESEDREAQSAKLQELIRRGTPRDLAAAQELMKSLAGAEPDKKPDYRTQALNEINKLESKVILLNEMLDNVDVERGSNGVTIKEKFVDGDAYDQVASILKAARPKLQKWVEEAGAGTDAGEDSESLDTFLQMNDQINTVLNRFEAFKKGDYVQAANPIPQELGGGSASAGHSLIDFDDSSNSNGASTATAAGGSNTLTDLGGLFSASNTMPVMESRIGLGLPGMNISGMQTPVQSQTPPIPSVPNYSSTPPIPNMFTPPIMGMQGLNISGTPFIPSMPGISMNVGVPTPPMFGVPGMQSNRNTSTPPIQQPMHSGTMPPAYTSSYVTHTMGMGMSGGLQPQHSGSRATSQTQTPQAPNYFSNNTGPQGPVRMNSGMSQGSQPASTTTNTQSQTSQSRAQGAGAAKDPFADLAGLF